MLPKSLGTRAALLKIPRPTAGQPGGQQLGRRRSEKVEFTRVEFSGWIYKRGAGFEEQRKGRLEGASEKRRFFLLLTSASGTLGGELRYYTKYPGDNPDDAIHKGSIALGPGEATVQRSGSELRLVTPSRTFYLRCDEGDTVLRVGPAYAQQWVVAISNVLHPLLPQLSALHRFDSGSSSAVDSATATETAEKAEAERRAVLSNLAGVLSERGRMLGFRSRFREFCAENFATENVDFYLAVESYERMPTEFSAHTMTPLVICFEFETKRRRNPVTVLHMITKQPSADK